jgi:hypothetical protein
MIIIIDDLWISGRKKYSDYAFVNPAFRGDI